MIALEEDWYRKHCPHLKVDIERVIEPGEVRRYIAAKELLSKIKFPPDWYENNEETEA